MSALTTYRETINQLVAKYDAARARVRTERKALDEIDLRRERLLEAQTIAQAVAEKIQTQAHKRIASIVTTCLAIFDEPYEFRIDFRRARGKTEAHLLFERDGMAVDPMTSSGGGPIDVAAFALRVACMVLRRPALRRLLALDEPFRCIHEQYRPRIRAVLEKLATDLDMQIVMVTHDPQLKAGKEIDLGD